MVPSRAGWASFRPVIRPQCSNSGSAIFAVLWPWRASASAALRAVLRDEEDVALSAFDSFCRSAEQGRFPELADRDGLWRLLMVMTARKAMHLRRDEGRQKRGGGAHFTTDTPIDPDEESVLGQVLSREPTPEFATQMSEECERLLDSLCDAELRSVALLRMEGYTLEEIADRLGCVARTVKRKLKLIRSIWEKERSS